MKRAPSVAGQFYNGTPESLTRQVSQYILDSPKEPVLGALCPHAGLMYSGHVAGAVYSRIEFPETFVLLGPNHTGLGSPISVMSEGQWEIPTGTFDIEKVLAHKIHTLSDGLVEKDSRAHLFEHSIEVQLPFIAYFSTSVKIVPIALMTLDLETCHKVAQAIVSAIKLMDYRITIIASSDMSHYVSDTEARALDGLAIDKILQLDPEGLYKTVTSKKISMCGYIPATIMLYACIALGAQKAELIKYATSGEVSGDYNYVVGYAGIIVR